MTTSINQRNFGQTENHNQWQTYQLINVLIKVEKIHLLLTDFTWRYIAKSPPKTFRFPYISVLFVQKELRLLSRQKSTGIDNLPL